MEYKTRFSSSALSFFIRKWLRFSPHLTSSSLFFYSFTWVKIYLKHFGSLSILLVLVFFFFFVFWFAALTSPIFLWVVFFSSSSYIMRYLFGSLLSLSTVSREDCYNKFSRSSAFYYLIMLSVLLKEVISLKLPVWINRCEPWLGEWIKSKLHTYSRASRFSLSLSLSLSLVLLLLLLFFSRIIYLIPILFISKFKVLEPLSFWLLAYKKEFVS